MTRHPSGLIELMHPSQARPSGSRETNPSNKIRGSFGRPWLVALWTLLSLSSAGSLAGDVRITELYFQPRNGKPAEEWLELHNAGSEVVNLAGWRFASGIEFEFPAYLLAPDAYVVVCADTKTFKAAFPTVPAIGNWKGTLTDQGETLRLLDAEDTVSDKVHFASEGDWAQRWRVSQSGFPGWNWASLQAGLDNSIERILNTFDGSIGQNWKTSEHTFGSPGAPNLASRISPPPFILEVQHFPAIPSPSDRVVVQARILSSSKALPRASVRHRVDGSPTFEETLMSDDGLHGDGAAGDGIYGAFLPPRSLGTIVEFYVEAADVQGKRQWPEAVFGAPGAGANCLYQVDAEPAGTLPRYRLILTEAERQTLLKIEAQPWYLPSDAQMNATFIATEDGTSEIRYRCGLRQRGSTSRDIDPPSWRVNFPNDTPWRGLTALNLNGVRPHSQVVGSALARLAGLPAARARLVEVRENGIARTGVGSPVPGLYAQNEELDEQYLGAAFPGDSGGNLYGTSSFADLNYLGPESNRYSAPFYYTKETHRTSNDWSDLIELTRVLTESPTADFNASVNAVADGREWATYFACNFLMGNTESSLAYPSFRSGVWNTGDYFLYRGLKDTRFKLVPYDFDSVLGTEGGDVPDLYAAANTQAIRRLLSDPEFGSAFHSELNRLAQTVLSPASVSSVIDRLLQPHVPGALIQGMKSFIAGRPALLQAIQLPVVAITNTAPLSNGSAVISATTFRLGGTANPATTRTLRVQNSDVPVAPLGGGWSTEVALVPGMNRISVEAHAADGTLLTNLVYTLWHDAPAGLNVSGTLTANTVWKANQSPVVVLSDVVIPPGLTLTIEAGTTVSFAKDQGIIVQGRLLATGTPEHRIYMGVAPIYNATWKGIRFETATVENQLLHVDLGQSAPTPLFLTNSVATFEDLTFPRHNGNVMIAYYSSLIVRGCEFPNVTFGEPIGILGARAGGRVLFERNHFGSTIGYADVFEASLLKRPGPILEIFDNVFEGGGDDGLDLDGCDAHIEGNIFRHFHKDSFNQSTSISSAIAVGVYTHGETSDITAVRNLFVENDYDFEFKEFATLDVRHNTFVNGRLGSVAFSEPQRPGEALGKSARFEGCIWDGYTSPMANVDPSWITAGAVQVAVNHSLLNQPGPWIGTNVSFGDPRFVAPGRDWHLRADSPARNRVPPGVDAGAMVNAGPQLLDRPSPITDATSYAWRIAGPGITHFRFTFDGSDFSIPRTIDTPLGLNALPIGKHRVQLYGYGLNQRWQTEPTDTIEWEIVPPFSKVQLHEVLARNPTNVLRGGVFTDLIELHNPGKLPADLADMSLTDDPALPRKFVFPFGTQIPAKGFLILYADSASNPAGLHTGFGMASEGDGLFLFDKSTRNNVLIDEVRFGPQLVGKSIGRDPSGNWVLCEPTFGLANQPARVGDARELRINEFLAKNRPGSSDEFIELANPSLLPVALTGFSLCESLTTPSQHPLPQLGFVEAEGFLALKKDALGVALTLPSEFGVIGLHDDANQLVDAVVYGPQRTDISEGRSPDATGPFTPSVGGSTPGFRNQALVAMPLILIGRREAGSSVLTLELSGTQANQTYAIEGSGTSAAGIWQVIAQKTATGSNTLFSVQMDDGARFLRARELR